MGYDNSHGGRVHVEYGGGGFISGPGIKIDTTGSDLAALYGRYPGWQAWKGISGLWHARKLTGSELEPVVVTGEDLTDLADEIHRAQTYLDEGMLPPARS